tara:strand:+ start:309 stop:632 length:324 start_codon:yes stop_codon:yes gene_type:complete
MPDSQMNIFRVLNADEWVEFRKKKVFKGNSFDHKSGFIHLSTQKQLKETINLHFKNNKKIVILKFNANDLGDSLKWELSRNRELFPHLYDSLNFKHIKNVESFGCSV